MFSVDLLKIEEYTFIIVYYTEKALLKAHFYRLAFS